MRSLSILAISFVLFGCSQDRSAPVGAEPGGKVQDENAPTFGNATAGSPKTNAPLQSTTTPSATPSGNVPPKTAGSGSAPKTNPSSSSKSSSTVSTSVPARISPYMGGSAGQYREPRDITTSPKSTGACEWKVEDASNAWASKSLDKEQLKKCQVEAIFSVSDADLKVWKVDGSSYPDFEGFLRLKLQNNDKISFPMKYKKKTRVVVMRIPNMRGASANMVSQSVDFRFSQTGNMYELSNGEFGNDYRLQYFAVNANKEDQYASIPAECNINQSVGPISVKAGQKFSLGGANFEIVEVRAFDKNDMPDQYRMQQFKGFSTVVLKSDSNLGVRLSAYLRTEMMNSYNGTERISIDDKGNLVKKKIDPNNFRGYDQFSQPQLTTVSESNGTIKMVANVNTKFLESVGFTVSSSIPLTLVNVPIEK